MTRRKKYDYMIKTVKEIDDKLLAYGDFEYPKKKGALILPKEWNPEPECGNGIHGMVWWTYKHSIKNNNIWMILKYISVEAIVIGNNKIKVPQAWVVAWGTAEEIQKKWGELTCHTYQYDYATQTAGNYSVQKAGYHSTQIAEEHSTQTAGYHSTQTAGEHSVQKSGAASIQIAGNASTQTAGGRSTQTAGYHSTQTARDASTQTAGTGSVSIIRGQNAIVQHIGKVLQVFVFYNDEYIYLTKIISDNKKHRLECKQDNNKNWYIKDTIIENNDKKEIR